MCSKILVIKVNRVRWRESTESQQAGHRYKQAKGREPGSASRRSARSRKNHPIVDNFPITLYLYICFIPYLLKPFLPPGLSGGLSSARYMA